MAEPPRLYESALVRQATGNTIRPGGLTLLQRAMELCAMASGARVLDVGCGTGASTAYLRHRYQLRAAGVDLSAKLLLEGSVTVPGLPLIRGRAEYLPCRNACLDGLVSECVLSLLSDSHAALSEFNRVLKPGARLIVSDIYRRAPDENGQAEVSVPCCVASARSHSFIRKQVLSAGLELQLWEDHSYLLGNLAARLILDHGSLQAFWVKVFGETAGQEIAHAVAASRPGYFLMIAQKRI